MNGKIHQFILIDKNKFENYEGQYIRTPVLYIR